MHKKSWGWLTFGKLHGNRTAVNNCHVQSVYKGKPVFGKLAKTVFQHSQGNYEGLHHPCYSGAFKQVKTRDLHLNLKNINRINPPN